MKKRKNSRVADRWWFDWVDGEVVWKTIGGNVKKCQDPPQWVWEKWNEWVQKERVRVRKERKRLKLVNEKNERYRLRNREKRLTGKEWI